MTQSEYLADPCGVSSLPYWKTEGIQVPEHMQIVHHRDFSDVLLDTYQDEPYFRLRHSLAKVDPPVLPAGFSFGTASLAEFSQHINHCYDKPCMTEAILEGYRQQPVFCEALWLVIQEEQSGAIAASGIAALDQRIGEGILDWIQVSRDCRRMGLGRCMVSELLNRLRSRADFVTVSGQIKNPGRPEALYRSCGFTGEDVWHVLTKKCRL